MAHRAPTGSHRKVKYNPRNPHHVFDPDKTRTDMPVLPDELPHPESHPEFYQEPEPFAPSYDAGKEVLLRAAIFAVCLIGAVAIVLIMRGL
jgi:hypothetical protein